MLLCQPKPTFWLTKGETTNIISSGDIVLKTEILNIIGAKPDVFVSGQALAEELNVSRNAVWKAVNELKADGYIIETSAKKGYKLALHNKKLCSAEILLHTSQITPIIYDSLESTNTTARLLAQQNAKEGTLVLAERQTNGRGRMGRDFFSPEGGIYMSIVLRPKIQIQQTLLLTVAAAVATAESIEEISGRKTQIKWVNDIYIDSKKVCGILTEGAICAESASLEYAILGIGINTDCPSCDFPEKLQQKAQSVFEGEAFSRDKARLIGEFCNRFFEIYNGLENTDFISRYQQRSFLDGKTVEFYKDGKKQTAKAIKIDDDARLIVKIQNETIALSSGDVQLEGFFK